MPNSKHELQKFKLFPEFKKIRVEIIDSDPWFASKDICNLLGVVNNIRSLIILDKNEKQIIFIRTSHGVQPLNFVNEVGLYKIILISRKPLAKKFRLWLANEVLHSIRKTGKYRNAANRRLKKGGVR